MEVPLLFVRHLLRFAGAPLIASVIGSIALLAIPSADGYVLEGPSWQSGSLVKFQMGLGSANRTLADGNTSWNAAAAPAATAWDDVMAHLDLQTQTSTPPVNSGDGVNAIVFSSTVFGDQWDSGTLAITQYRSSGNRMIEADVLFNTHQTFDSYRGPQRFNTNGNEIADIRRVLTHELGHALGLDHPDEHGQTVDAIMNSHTSDRYTLSNDDIAGAQALYGAPAAQSTTTPLDDFNNDSSPDFLLYNNARQTAIWYLSNNAFVSGVFGPAAPAGWRVAGVADFNGDGHPDYLLFNSSTRQSAIWYLSGGTFLSGVMGPTIASGYLLVGAADFNGDGKPDYLLYNRSSGQTAIWYMNNNALVSGLYGPTLPANWRVAGVADFNQDGKVDYLLFNSSTRQSAIWYLSGTTLIDGRYGPPIASGYILEAAADFDGDNKPDYLLYNSTTRTTAIWYLSDNLFSSGVYGPGLPSGWGFAGP